jgi:hypothetical protein
MSRKTIGIRLLMFMLDESDTPQPNHNLWEWQLFPLVAPNQETIAG